MKVFIGSSSERIELLRYIEELLINLDHEPLPWDKPGLFQAGEFTLESLIKVTKIVDVAFFIFSEDDQLWYNNNSVSQPRDNVLFEYGLFMGKLGRKNCVILREGNPKTASDLKGINYINISENSKQRAEAEIASWIKTIDAINQVISPKELESDFRLNVLTPLLSSIVSNTGDVREARRYLGTLKGLRVRHKSNFSSSQDFFIESYIEFEEAKHMLRQQRISQAQYKLEFADEAIIQALKINTGPEKEKLKSEIDKLKYNLSLAKA